MAEIAERTRYFERYVTFIDAIVAIAITLLVLPLVELTSDHHGTTSELLRDHAAQFLLVRPELSGDLPALVVAASAASFCGRRGQGGRSRTGVVGDDHRVPALPDSARCGAVAGSRNQGSLHRDNGSQCCVPGGGRVGSGSQPVVE